jgi:hypothetical protein
MALSAPDVMRVLLAAFAVAVLIAGVAVLRWERRELVQRGKGRAWRVVRLATVPIALATVAALVLPAGAVSGMEALGVFYLLLFTAAPLAWFGLHWLVGRMTRPPLSFADSLQLAVLPPAFAIAVALGAQALQPVGWSIALAAERASFALAEDAPPRHVLASAQRYATPAGDVLTARWQASPEVRVERIDVVVDGQVLEDAGRRQGHRICRAPGEIVLLRAANEAVPLLRVYWRDAGARLRRSTLAPPTPEHDVPFAVAWQGETGFALPEPLPRQTLWLGHARDGAVEFGSSEAQQYRPGESPETSCRTAWQGSHPVAGVRVRVETATAEPLWLEALRPPEVPDARIDHP